MKKKTLARVPVPPRMPPKKEDKENEKEKEKDKDGAEDDKGEPIHSEYTREAVRK